MLEKYGRMGVFEYKFYEENNKKFIMSDIFNGLDNGNNISQMSNDVNLENDFYANVNQQMEPQGNNNFQRQNSVGGNNFSFQLPRRNASSGAKTRGGGKTKTRSNSKLSVPKPSSGMNIFKSFWSLIWSPVGKGKTVVEKGNWIHGLIFIVLQCLCTGFFVSAVMGKANTLISSAIKINKIYGQIVAEIFKLPVARSVYVTFCLVLILNLFVTGIIWIINKILRTGYNLGHAILIVSSKATAMLPCIVIAYLLIKVNCLIALTFFVLATVWRYFRLICLHGKFIKGRKKIAFLGLIIVAIFIYLNVTSFAICKSILLYLPSSVRHAIDDPSKLIGDAIKAIKNIKFK